VTTRNFYAITLSVVAGLLPVARRVALPPKRLRVGLAT